MAENNKSNKNLIIGICSVAVIAVVAVILVVVLINKKNSSINDAYFVSDDTKYVLSLDTGGDEEYMPLKTHAVYYYKGNQITDLKTFLEYADADSAKNAYDYVNETEGGSYKETYIEGKYIVMVSNEAEYENTTATDVKEQIDFINSLNDPDSETEEENIETLVIDVSE